MSTPRPSQKKQATLTSFFTQKSSSQPPSSPIPSQPKQTSQPRPSQQSQQLPSRKRPLEKQADQNKVAKGKGRAAKATETVTEKENNDDDDEEDEEATNTRRSRFERAVKRARTVVADEDNEDDEENEENDKDKEDDDFVLEDAPAEVEAEEEPELPPPRTTQPASSQLRSSGRTDRYIYSEPAQADGPSHSQDKSQHSSDSESDDPETKRRKEELHRKFVKKLGHPDSMVNMRRRNLDAVPFPGADAEGGEDMDKDEEEDDEPQPKKGAKKKGKLTPMELQFLAIKRKHMDTLLVVEVGYKFKFLGEDARSAARVLGIVCIPGKMRYDEHASEAHLDRFASASIPVPRLPVHVKRLVAAGHKVGVVRQMETAALKKAGDNRNAPFVRQLTNIYTKGTYIEEDELGASSGSGSKDKQSAPSSGYLLCLTESKAGGAGADEKVQVGMLAVQPATGDIIYDSFEDGFMRNEVETRLLHIAPCELLLVGDTDMNETHLSKATEKLVQHISGSATNVFGDRTRVERVARTKPSDAYTHVAEFYSGKLAGDDTASIVSNELLDKVLALPENVTVCLSAMITHLTEYGLQHIFDLTKYFSSFTTRQHMLLNGTTLESLEVYRNTTDHSLRGSLLWALDKTQTRFGHRLLRKWIGRPLLDRTALEARVEAVEELLKAASSQKRDKLEQLLSGGGNGGGKTDLERSLIRIYYGKCTRSELVAVLQTLQRISSSYAGMPGTLAHPASSGFTSPLILNCIKAIPAIHKTVAAYLDKINAEAARTNDNYQFFRDAHETEDITNYKVGIAAVEAELDEHRAEIAKTLGKAAKPNYVTVAGIEYLVEVNNAGGDLKRVPASWIKISGTKRASRFHTPTVVQLINERDQHKENLAAACDTAFRDLLSDIGSHYQPLRDTVAALATLDCLLSLAKVAALPGYSRPILLESEMGRPGTIDIQGGRHPVAEHTLPSGYIPFSTKMGGEDGSLALLVTGPNMGGKSSFVRAVALLTLLAQIGSYVPADSMQLTLADAIFTRMGARDNLFAGESTFMVEVSETAAILRAATPRSLVVLDELGRGTSTHDGAAIAQAVLEHVARDTRCLTLFITHYQSLGRAALAQFGNADRAPIQNVHMAFREDKETEEITFLYEVAPGMAHRSYGLNVAKLANVPQRVLDIAAGKSHDMEMDVRRRRLQAAVKLAAGILGPDTDAGQPTNPAGVDQLEYLMSCIEQL